MKILLIGANGKMGKAMQQFVATTNHSCICVDKQNCSQLLEFCADVILDFSTAECLKQNLNYAIKTHTPIVVATTNHSLQNLKLVNKAKQKIAVFMAANLSLLFNVLLNAIGALKGINNCDVLLEETHHKTKKDAPSGSCLQLKNALAKLNVTPTICAHRMGNVVGMHSIKIFAEDETLHIAHTAHNRQVFCRGALAACQFVLNKPANLYTMQDLLNSH